MISAMPENLPMTCDIFCRVVDNFGDIGVCWRIAREWHARFGCAVRLWCDEVARFVDLCPTAQRHGEAWLAEGVWVHPWPDQHCYIEPAAWVIEAFACELPPHYVAAMAAQPVAPLWINLEYLSAESWVEGCHGLTSPHPQTGLQKYFFFPGFTPQTGGLLCERGLHAQRRALQADAAQQSAFLQRIGVADVLPGRRISLFAYETPELGELLDCWANSDARHTVLVPLGKVLADVARYFGCDVPAVGSVLTRGSLRLQVLPFLSQTDYDRLLWCCDVNFVRGEDSFVRAQWAARPMVWQIYRQQDGVHYDKLAAFMARYWSDGEDAAGRDLWWAWNGRGDVAAAWQKFAQNWTQQHKHAQAWCAKLQKGPELLDSLVEFRKSVLK